MKRFRNAFSIAALCCLFYTGNPVHAQSPFLDKLEAEEIFETAHAGKSQELMVSFETGDIEDRLGKQRIALHNRAESARKFMKADAVEQSRSSEFRDDDNLLQTLHSQLNSVKSAALNSVSAGNSVITRDFEHLSLAVVRIPDETSLLQLIASPSVKRIYADRKTKPIANWPSSYSDISIIHSDIRNGLNGYKGAGTRVVVLDTGIYVKAVPGWIEDGSAACNPYVYTGSAGSSAATGYTFTESNFAIGGTNLSANCRIWSMYDMTNSAICASPVTPVFGMPDPPCHNSGWQHGTAIDDVIARVAPSTYITNLQVYDNLGAGTPAYAIAGLQWVIQNHLQTPRIVAVNYSGAVVGTDYTKSCPTSQFAGPISTLLNTYGILTVTGTGNDGVKLGVTDPACVPGVIAVGATTDSSVPAQSYPQYGGCSDPALGADQVPCFSNTNSTLTSMLAPGVDIGYSTELIAGDATSVAAGSGTSLSAPHVAGAIAILMGDNAYGKNLTATQIKTLLTTSGPLVADRNSTTNSKHRLDILAAMGTAGATTPHPVSIWLSSTSVAIPVGSSTAFSAFAKDQFGNQMDGSSLTWSISWNPSGIAANASSSFSGPIYNFVISGSAAGSTTMTVKASNTSGAGTSVDVPVTVSSQTGINPPNCKANPRACS